MTTTPKEQLVTANRILSNEGILGGVGHVSVRTAKGNTMLISRSRSPAFVTTDDIIRMDFDGTLLDDGEAVPYKETVIHRSIYRQREDVGAVVHHHAPAVMPFTATDVELRPVFHLGALFHSGVPLFDEYDATAGRLVVTEDEGDRMAGLLGDHRAQLLAGHGANVVGDTIKEAVLGAIYLSMNASYQFQAELLGEPRYLADEAALEETVQEAILSPTVIERVWEYYCRRLPNREASA